MFISTRIRAKRSFERNAHSSENKMNPAFVQTLVLVVATAALVVLGGHRAHPRQRRLYDSTVPPVKRCCRN